MLNKPRNQVSMPIKCSIFRETTGVQGTTDEGIPITGYGADIYVILLAFVA